MISYTKITKDQFYRLGAFSNPRLARVMKIKVSEATGPVLDWMDQKREAQLIAVMRATGNASKNLRPIWQ